MVTIYHNNRCSKSRQTLQLIKESGIDPEIIYYLNTPPDRATLKRLNMNPRQIIRTSEKVYQTLNLKDDSLSEDDLLDALMDHPKLLQSPIVVCAERAVIGRPPEKVLEIL